MDTLQVIVSIVQSVGFPIVMCGAMGWFVKYTYDDQRKEVSELNSAHAKEMTSITEALNNNTLAVQKLCDMIDKEN